MEEEMSDLTAKKPTLHTKYLSPMDCTSSVDEEEMESVKVSPVEETLPFKLTRFKRNSIPRTTPRQLPRRVTNVPTSAGPSDLVEVNAMHNDHEDNMSDVSSDDSSSQSTTYTVWECEICEEMYQTIEAAECCEMMHQHQGEVWPCRECQKMFPTQEARCLCEQAHSPSPQNKSPFQV